MQIRCFHLHEMYVKRFERPNYVLKRVLTYTEMLEQQQTTTKKLSLYFIF